MGCYPPELLVETRPQFEKELRVFRNHPWFFTAELPSPASSDSIYQPSLLRALRSAMSQNSSFSAKFNFPVFLATFCEIKIGYRSCFPSFISLSFCPAMILSFFGCGSAALCLRVKPPPKKPVEIRCHT